MNLLLITRRIFRSGQFFVKSVKPETVMDTLVENTSETGFAFKYYHVFDSGIPRSDSSG
jgi:hypothetical protein